MKFLFSLFAFMMLIESCNSSKKTIENSNKMQATLSGNYIITQIGDNNSISEKLTIAFDDKSNKVSGFTGCNTFFGTYVLESNNITFNNIASSKKFCGRKINNIERHFLETLKTTNAFTINDNLMSLTKNDTVLLKLTKSAVTKKSEIVKDNYDSGIIYKASSRGFFEYIQISKSKILISSDTNLKETTNYKCQEKDWEELKRLLKEVNIKTFQKLNAPTDKRLFDGAAHATLAIKKGDVVYNSSSFDHGSPPKEIETLVNKVLSIKENAVKQ